MDARDALLAVLLLYLHVLTFAFTFFAVFLDYRTTVAVGLSYPQLEANPSTRRVLEAGDVSSIYHSAVITAYLYALLVALSAIISVMSFIGIVPQYGVYFSVGVLIFVLTLSFVRMFVVYNNLGAVLEVLESC